MKRSLNLLLTGALGMMMFSACAKNGNQAANGATDSAKMTAEANKTKTKAFYENIINAHKTDNIADYCAASFTDHNPDPGMDGNGLENNKKNFNQWFTMMPDVHMTVDNIAAEGDMVWVMYHMSGTWKAGDMMGVKPTNKSANVGGVDIIKIKDGKATDRWGYYDQMAMMQQFGMMPPPPGAPAEKKM